MHDLMAQNRIHLPRKKLLPSSKITPISKGMWKSFQIETKKISGNKDFIHLFFRRADRTLAIFLKMIHVQMRRAANSEMRNRTKNVGGNGCCDTYERRTMFIPHQNLVARYIAVTIPRTPEICHFKNNLTE